MYRAAYSVLTDDITKIMLSITALQKLDKQYISTYIVNLK